MRFTSSRPHALLAQLLMAVAALGCCAQVHAQTSPPITQAAAQATPQVATPNRPGHPLWMDLSESQQQALAPLAQQWPTMTEPHKRKWLVLSKNFSQLSADEQTTLQSRMREWAELTPQKRAAVRLNFADAQQMLQEDKKSKWEAYQALSPEAKRKLAEQTSQPVGGAALAVKPMAANKLVSPPPASSNKALPRIATDQLAPITLLPHATAKSPTAPVVTPGTEPPPASQ